MKLDFLWVYAFQFYNPLSLPFLHRFERLRCPFCFIQVPPLLPPLLQGWSQLLPGSHWPRGAHGGVQAVGFPPTECTLAFLSLPAAGVLTALKEFNICKTAATHWIWYLPVGSNVHEVRKGWLLYRQILHKQKSGFENGKGTWKKAHLFLQLAFVFVHCFAFWLLMHAVHPKVLDENPEEGDPLLPCQTRQATVMAAPHLTSCEYAVLNYHEQCL